MSAGTCRTSAIIQFESRAAACLMIARVRSLMGLPLMAFEIGVWLSFDSRFKGRIPRALNRFLSDASTTTIFVIFSYL
jgi:hypothetical protein